jgi:hypothetical protein
MPRPEADIAVDNCRAWLEWAAVQVEVCLEDDKPACDQLLASLAKLLEPAAHEPAAQNLAAHVPDAVVPSADSTVIQKMSAVVVAVQSHDRVMQRLTHVAESLRRLQEHLGDERRARSAESWRTLREQQMRAFSMAEERALFLRIAAHEDGIGQGTAPNPQDAIEIFMPEIGLGQP